MFTFEDLINFDKSLKKNDSQSPVCAASIEEKGTRGSKVPKSKSRGISKCDGQGVSKKGEQSGPKRDKQSVSKGDKLTVSKRDKVSVSK